MTELQEFTDLPNAMSGILVLYMDVSKNRGTLEGCNKEKSQQTTWGLLSLFDLRLDGLDHSFHAFPHAWGRSSSSNNTKNNTQGHLLRTPTIELRTTFIDSIPARGAKHVKSPVTGFGWKTHFSTCSTLCILALSPLPIAHASPRNSCPGKFSAWCNSGTTTTAPPAKAVGCCSRSLVNEMTSGI